MIVISYSGSQHTEDGYSILPTSMFTMPSEASIKQVREEIEQRHRHADRLILLIAITDDMGHVYKCAYSSQRDAEGVFRANESRLLDAADAMAAQ